MYAWEKRTPRVWLKPVSSFEHFHGNVRQSREAKEEGCAEGLAWVSHTGLYLAAGSRQAKRDIREHYFNVGPNIILKTWLGSKTVEPRTTEMTNAKLNTVCSALVSI